MRKRRFRERETSGKRRRFSAVSIPLRKVCAAFYFIPMVSLALDRKRLAAGERS